MKRVWRWALVLGLGFSNVVNAAPLPFTEQQIRNLGIELASVTATQTTARGHIPARVALPPANIRVLSAPQSGLIHTVQVAAGDSVTQGQVLARLRSHELLDLQRDYLQALSEQQLADKAFQRDSQLFADGIIAERRYLDTESRLTQAQAGLSAQRQMLALAGMESAAIERLTTQQKLSAALVIRAPLDGVVLARYVASGERVEPMQRLFRLADPRTLWLEMRAPLERLDDLPVGARVAVDATPAAGKILMIGREVDPENQTVLVRAEITEGTQALRVEQFVEVHVDTPTEAPVFRLPQAATVRSGERSLVFVRVPGGFAPTPVTLVSEHERYAVVRGDLSAADEVAVNGVSALKSAWQSAGQAE